jgi:hypothetical protein
MPRSFSQQDYSFSKFYSTQKLDQASLTLNEFYTYADNLFSALVAQTLTIPANFSEAAWPLGAMCTLTPIGTAGVSVTPDAGVTLNSSNSAVSLGTTAYGGVFILKRLGPNDWLLLKATSGGGGGGGTFSGALVNLTADQALSGSLGDNTLSGFTVDYDTDSYYDAGSPTRLTVPASVTYVRLTAQVIVHSNPGAWNAEIRKNDAGFGGGPLLYQAGFTAAANQAILVTGPLAVTPGDYFNLHVGNTNAGNALATFNTTRTTWFSIEKVT